MSNQYPPSGDDPQGQDPSRPGDQPPPPSQWGGAGGSSAPYGDQPGAYPPGSYPPANYPPGNYPSGPGGPGGYGEPGYGPGYGQPARTSPLAIISLVLGIVGLCCGQVFALSIGAAVTGFLGRKQIRESQGRLKGGGMALAGLILGLVGIVIGILYWILIAAGVLNGNYNFSTSP